MAFSSDIVIGAETFSLITVRPTSSVRSDASRELHSPSNLTISHEVSKTGSVQSVVFNDRFYVEACDTTCGIAASQRKVRAQIKLSYDPTGEYAMLETELKVALAGLLTFLGDDANVNKFLNKET